MFVRNALCAAALLAVVAAGSASAGIGPGQYNVGGAQQICLKPDHTWFGTTYVWSGHWESNPNASEKAALWGNYQNVGSYYGYFNDTLTVKAGNKMDWYDYSDDDAYHTFLPDLSFTFVKRNCDPKATVISKTRRAVTQ